MGSEIKTPGKELRSIMERDAGQNHDIRSLKMKLGWKDHSLEWTRERYLSNY